MLGLVPSISVGPMRGLANDPHDTINQDARHKGEHDNVDVASSRIEACLLARVPAEGRGRVRESSANNGLTSAHDPAPNPGHTPQGSRPRA
jgi:hypothetical protein